VSHELLRPRSVTELLDAAFTLIRAHLPVYATLAVVAALPVLVASTLTMVALPDAAVNGTAASEAGEIAATTVGLGAMLLILVFTLAAWLWFFVAGSSLIFATSDAYRGQPVDAGSAFRRAMRSAGDVIGASIAKYVVLFGIVVGTGIGAALLALASPILAALAVCAGLGAVIVMSLRWFVVTAVAALEDVTGSDALSRSAKLTNQAGARIFLIGLVIFALAFSFSIASTFALSFAGSAVVAGIANSLWLLLYPFANVIEAVTYFDQRIRTEGFDLEMMAQQLGPTAGDALGRQPI
jgi:hypothetical protein